MSNPICVGIIGFGRSGYGIHASAMSMIKDLYDVVAVCDEIPERRACEEFPDATGYAVAEELIADQRIELVVVASYNYQHAMLAEKALNAGKHVLCEKPFGYTVADVDSMIAAAKRNQRILQPFQQRRYEDDFQQVLKICRSGILGKICSVRISWSDFTRRWDWQTSRKYGGGQLYNNGPHLVDHGMEIFGDSTPKVTARFRNALSSGDAEDEFNLLLQGKNAPDVEMIISATNDYPQDRWLICGTAGTLHGSDSQLEWKFIDWHDYPKHQLDVHPIEGRRYCSEKLEFKTGLWQKETAQNGNGAAGAPPAKRPVFAMYNKLYRIIRSGEAQEITPEQIRRRIAVMEEAYRQNGIPFPKMSK